MKKCLLMISMMLALAIAAGGCATKGDLEDVQARGGQLYVIADRSAGANFSERHGEILHVDTGSKFLAPVVLTVPLQLLAYHIAVLRGEDVDQPRNLAKAVTVE